MTKIKDTDKCAILFSGGTDSTLAAALLMNNFEEIHLLTFERFGLFKTKNIKDSARRLIEKYSDKKITHTFININNLFKYLSYERYLLNVKKFGFFNLSTCGLCKLSMHVATISYCLKNNIKNVSDGANKGMDIFPAQMKPVIILIKDLYNQFDINYSTPVYDFEPNEDDGFIAIENINMLSALNQLKKKSLADTKDKKTTEKSLYELGLTPKINIKGTPYDKKLQARCFQFILFKIFAKVLYLSKHSYESYTQKTVIFFQEKIKISKQLLDSNINDILKF